ncbi:MAG: DUF1501 domain-containing protein, partial [Myxococcota bacterium]
LNLVVPHGDPNYYDLRPSTRVRPGDELDLDGFFGLHPSLAPLLPLYDAGSLAVIHAAGSPHRTRSHFVAQDYMETTALGDSRANTGWLNRFLLASDSNQSIAGVTIGATPSLSLRGPAPTLTFRSVSEFVLANGPKRSALEDLYALPAGDLLGSVADATFPAIDALGQIPLASSAGYPDSFGGVMNEAAGLIRADIGVRAISVDLVGWDHHRDEAKRLEPVAADLAGTLAAFYASLGEDAERTLTLAITEFGRTARENGSRGTDHGHGSVILALGGGVSGGRVLLAGNQWPGLGPRDLYEGRDLAVTTDFRNVFGEVLDRYLGLARPSDALTDYWASPFEYPGLFA